MKSKQPKPRVLNIHKDLYWSGSLKAAVQELNDIWNSIPAAERENATAYVAGGEWESVHIEIDYQHTETKEELEQRLAAEEDTRKKLAAEMKEYRKKRDEQDRKIYERLKKRYEPRTRP